MSKTSGLAAIVEEEAPTDRPPAAAPVQLVLGASYQPLRPVEGALGPVPLAPDDSEDGGDLVQGERRVGRPPGRRNKSTEAWRRFILGQHGSPLQALARIYASDPSELAAAIGIKRNEALGHIIAAARVALPYLHSPQPTDVRVEGKGAFAFTVFTGQRPEGRGDIQIEETDPLVALERLAHLPSGSLEERDGTIVENQAVSASAPAESNSAESNGAPESEADQ